MIPCLYEMHMLKFLSLSTQEKKKKTVESVLVGDVIMYNYDDWFGPIEID